MGLVETLPPLSCGVARSSLWPHVRTDLATLPGPAFDVETEASCGISVVEAREALAFGRRRLARLPRYRAAARAEAREMVVRWQRRVVRAELERWRLRGLTRFLFPRDRPVWAASRHPGASGREADVVRGARH
jgi:hypothetical protein